MKPRVEHHAKKEGSNLMLLNVLKGKIHRATVTQAELDYIGSITIDSELMEAARHPGIRTGYHLRLQ